jgi:hypothetical protein
MCHERKEGVDWWMGVWGGEDINGISGVYYTQIVSLVDRQIGRDEDQ